MNDPWTFTTVADALEHVEGVYGAFDVRRTERGWRATVVPMIGSRSRVPTGVGRTIAEAILDLANDGNDV